MWESKKNMSVVSREKKCVVLKDLGWTLDGNIQCLIWKLKTAMGIIIFPFFYHYEHCEYTKWYFSLGLKIVFLI